MGGISVVCDTKVRILRQIGTKATGIGELNEVSAAKAKLSGLMIEIRK
jgi:hypothetical protein